MATEMKRNIPLTKYRSVDGKDDPSYEGPFNVVMYHLQRRDPRQLNPRRHPLFPLRCPPSPAGYSHRFPMPGGSATTLWIKPYTCEQIVFHERADLKKKLSNHCDCSDVGDSVGQHAGDFAACHDPGAAAFPLHRNVRDPPLYRSLFMK